MQIFKREGRNTIVPKGLLQLAAASYGFDITTCQFITFGRDRFKQIYRFTIADKFYMLRVLKTPAGYISRIRAEMDWLLYLANKGISVPSPLKSGKGELALSVSYEEETYILSAFSMVHGKHWDKNNPNLWNKEIFYHWGKTVGHMHRFTKDYQPSNNTDVREVFHIRSMISENIKSFPTVHKITENLLSEIEALPKDKNSFGLIHNDLHPGNFLIEGKQIHLFDFDNCGYSWYTLDIATALYLALWFGRNNDAGEDFTNDIIRCFLSGYQAANPLNKFWLSKIPLFMMCCKTALFGLGVDSEIPGNEYNNKLEKEQMYNIENNILFSGSPVDLSLF